MMAFEHAAIKEIDWSVWGYLRFNNCAPILRVNRTSTFVQMVSLPLKRKSDKINGKVGGRN